MLPTPRKLMLGLIGSLLLSIPASPQVEIAQKNGIDKIAFVSDRDGNPEIYSMNPDGSGQTRLTYNSVSDGCPVWSHDGRRIAFLRANGNGKRSVFIMNADGSSQFEAISGLDVESCISWSPDGRKIAFSYQFNIYTVNIDGTNLGYLTAGSYPAWSPDGTMIAFSKPPPPPVYGTDIYTIGLPNGNLTRITQVTGYPGASGPSWSPDSTKIAFSYDFDLGDYAGIGIASSIGGSPLLLATQTDWLSPKWSPTGHQLVAQVPSPVIGQNTQIWQFNSDGSGTPIRLTAGPYNNYEPDWRQTIVPATAMDFDGDGRADISIYRPQASAEWWVLKSSDDSAVGVAFGTAGDAPVPADYTGDGRTDVAVWRPSNGFWYILRSEDSTFYGYPFGASTDLPVLADFDDDGKADTAVYRPSEGAWYILGSSAGFSGTRFGAAEDRPEAADYDGDGKADIAVFRPSNGTWYILGSTAGFRSVQFGFGTDQPVPGDYDGDGKTDVAVFRSGTWYVLGSQIGFRGYIWGLAGDKPVPADYDGDGKTDIAVFRDGNWWALQSGDGTVAVHQFGLPDDTPVPGRYSR